MTVAEELPDLESLRRPPLADNPCLRGMLAEKPIWKVRTGTGDEGWLVLGHAEIKQLLTDPRVARAHPNPAEAARLADNPVLDMIQTTAQGADPHEVHAFMRQLLVPFFTHRRMQALRPRIQQIVDDALDAMLAKPQPGDLWADFCLPVPLLVLGEMVGVPVDERERLAALLERLHHTGDAAGDVADLVGYLTDLVNRKRGDPGEDLISVIGPGLDDWVVASVITMLLFAGYDSVATQVANGVTRLLTRPDLRRQLVEDPSLVENAVEEMLRTSNVGGTWQPHYALADIEIAGVTIKAGDLVLPDFAMANHDPEVFDDPVTVDFHRKPNPHLTFATGAWHCIGAPLVRLELGLFIRTILTRVPTLRLTMTLEEILQPSDDDAWKLSGTIDRLPVAW
ncbi:MAG: cytochrome P450 [Actinomycetota bacterium]|nr:cytochrome P450 [Actinomycetota bacterium]